MFKIGGETVPEISILKPCPFCGGKAALQIHPTAYGLKWAVYAVCTGPGCTVRALGGIFGSTGHLGEDYSLDGQEDAAQRAIARWNHRQGDFTGLSA